MSAAQGDAAAMYVVEDRALVVVPKYFSVFAKAAWPCTIARCTTRVVLERHEVTRRSLTSRARSSEIPRSAARPPLRAVASGSIALRRQTASGSFVENRLGAQAHADIRVAAAETVADGRASTAPLGPAFLAFGPAKGAFPCRRRRTSQRTGCRTWRRAELSAQLQSNDGSGGARPQRRAWRFACGPVFTGDATVNLASPETR